MVLVHRPAFFNPARVVIETKPGSYSKLGGAKNKLVQYKFDRFQQLMQYFSTES